MRKTFSGVMGCAIGFILWTSSSVWAAEPFAVVIKEHQFDPAELVVPAAQKFKLVIKNEDATPEEFESKSLKREKIVPAKSQVVLNLGPLEPGTYEFFGEFHEATAKGRLIAR